MSNTTQSRNDLSQTTTNIDYREAAGEIIAQLLGRESESQYTTKILERDGKHAFERLYNACEGIAGGLKALSNMTGDASSADDQAYLDPREIAKVVAQYL